MKGEQKIDTDCLEYFHESTQLTQVYLIYIHSRISRIVSVHVIHKNLLLECNNMMYQ